MAETLPPPIRTLLHDSAELLELLDAYLAFGSTEQRHHAADARDLARRIRVELDASALRQQLGALA